MTGRLRKLQLNLLPNAHERPKRLDVFGGFLEECCNLGGRVLCCRKQARDDVGFSHRQALLTGQSHIQLLTQGSAA